MKIGAGVLIGRLLSAPGVTSRSSVLFSSLQDRIFTYGGPIISPTIPANLLELEAHCETWRTNRNYVREPIPDEIWNAAADLSRRYPSLLVVRVLKLDPSGLKRRSNKRSARALTRRKQPAASFQPSTEIALPEDGSSLPQRPVVCRLQIKLSDGSRLTLTLPSLDLVSISRFCADFLSLKTQ